MQSITATDAAHTEAIGACLARHHPRQAIVYLEGNLGAGKTTLVRGFVQACGHAGVVKSPTYTLVEPYVMGDTTIYHFDLYRLNDPQELEFIGAREMFGASAICLVEWPDKGAGELPPADLTIRLQVQGPSRQLKFLAGTPLGDTWLRRAQACLTQ